MSYSSRIREMLFYTVYNLLACGTYSVNQMDQIYIYIYIGVWVWVWASETCSCTPPTDAPPAAQF